MCNRLKEARQARTRQTRKRQAKPAHETRQEARKTRIGTKATGEKQGERVETGETGKADWKRDGRQQTQNRDKIAQAEKDRKGRMWGGLGVLFPCRAAPRHTGTREGTSRDRHAGSIST